MALAVNSREAPLFRAALRSSPPVGCLFMDLPAEATDAILAAGVRRRYRRGEPIFWEGDACEHLFFVLTGRVKLMRSLETGKELIVDLVTPGQSLGELAFIDGGPYPYSAQAHQAADVLAVERKDIAQLADRHPELYRKVIADLAAHHRALNDRLSDLAGTSVEKRIAQFFLSLIGDVANGTETRVDVPLSRQEIAEMVGTRVETSIRILSRWHKLRIVSRCEGGFMVNVSELTAIKMRAAR